MPEPNVKVIKKPYKDALKCRRVELYARELEKTFLSLQRKKIYTSL